MTQPELGLPSLPVGTEVSAKYRGAFCEARVKTVLKLVKCKVVLKDCQTSVFVTDEEIKGPVKLGSMVEVKHPETGQPVEGIINKLIDHSTYTVVFDDGDERTLRRSQLCLKGDKHFIESETLDNLPLSHPEHFGTPVLHNKKAKRKNDDESDDGAIESEEEESPRRAMYRGRHQELVGKLMLVDFPSRKGSVMPALVVLPDANSLNEVKNRDQILVRSFKDSKFMTVTRKGLKDFSRAVAINNDDKTLRTAFEKALLYYDTKELPVGWNKEEMLGSDVEDDCDEDVEDEYASEDEPFEEKDSFVAQLYKFMEERGTPINKGPCIGNKDLNLYKLFKIVEKLGGYSKITGTGKDTKGFKTNTHDIVNKDMKWPVVYSKMGLPSLHQNPAHQIRTAYKKYLDAFETFYCKLGSTMGTISRPGRARQNSACRSIPIPRAKEKSPRSQKPPDKVMQIKSEPENLKQKGEISLNKPKENQDAVSVVSPEEEDVVMRRTPRRDVKVQSFKEDSKEKNDETEKAKKEELSKNKKDDKKDECSIIKFNIEETSSPKINEEFTPCSVTKKDEFMKGRTEEDSLKKEERKSVRKIKGEEEKEAEKDEKKSVRVTKKQKVDEAVKDTKQEPETPVTDSLKKRVTRRKLMPSEPVQESEVKEEMDDAKEQNKKPVIKETKAIEKKDKEIPKTLEKRDSRSFDKKELPTKLTEKKEAKSVERKSKNDEDKLSHKEKKGQEDDEEHSNDSKTFPNSPCCDEEEQEFNPEKSDDNVRHEFPIGSRLKVKYGRGKHQKIYIAKVVDYGKDGVHKTYLVHYAGWNTRYDEWIRPDRVVSVLDRADGSKARTPPLRSPPFSGCLRKTPPSTSTTNTPKSMSSLNTPEQVFRTPKLIAAKSRSTRSSSSDTCVRGKRMTRHRSVLADSTGSKSPESNMSSDVDDASDSERADDDDDGNIKEDNTEDDDILDVEEYEGSEEGSLKGKSGDTSVEAEMNPSEETTSETGSERIHEEEEVENEINIDDQIKGNASISKDISNEIEQSKDSSKNLVKEDVCKEFVVKPVTNVDMSPSVSYVRQERATVSVVVVRDAVYEIRAAMSYGEGEMKHEENGNADEAETKSVPNTNVDIEDNESIKVDTVEEKEREDKDNGKDNSKSVQSDKASEEICLPDFLPDLNIPRLVKVDVEVVKKDKDSEKPKCWRGRKSNTPKEGKKLNKACDTAGSSLVSEIPVLEPMSILSMSYSDKLEPSPYDFDANMDTPWHPEITKKWETSQKTAVVLKEAKETASGEDEKDKKKVKKKAKKKLVGHDFVKDEGSVSVDEPICDHTTGVTSLKKTKKKLVGPNFVKDEESVSINEPICDHTADVASLPGGDTFAEGKGRMKKGRKQKVTISESKMDVNELYESTGNSVVEAVMHSLQEIESDQEQRLPLKRLPVKRVSDNDRKESSVRKAKIGRKVITRGSLDVLEYSVNIEDSDNTTDNTSASQCFPHSDPTLSQSVNSVDIPSISTSAAEPDTNVDIKDVKNERESQGFEPHLENNESSSVAFDNTPPNTPEHDGEDAENDAMQHTDSQYHSDDLSTKSDLHTDRKKDTSPSFPTISLLASSSKPAPLKSASESPSDNDVTSIASTDNLDPTITAQQSESSGTDQDVPSSKKRKILEDTFNSEPEFKKKKVHVTRSRTAKKSPKYIGNPDTQWSMSNTPSHCPESPPPKFADFPKSPRPSKYNFSADLGEYLEGEVRCNFLISKMREIKAIYMNLKAEVASIDRRRKRARRKEKESSQVPTTDKEMAT